MTTHPNHNTADQSGADERAISAAMSAANKRGIKSYAAAEIIGVYLATMAQESRKLATPQPFPAPAVQSGELPELPEPTVEIRGEYAAFTTEQMQAYALQAIAQTAPAVAGAAAWIPVEQSLPEQRAEPYQVIAACKKTYDGQYTGKQIRRFQQDWVVRQWPQNFTHWMEAMPWPDAAPPKGAKQ